jgi:hypothetical protein
VACVGGRERCSFRSQTQDNCSKPIGESASVLLHQIKQGGRVVASLAPVHRELSLCSVCELASVDPAGASCVRYSTLQRKLPNPQNCTTRRNLRGTGSTIRALPPNPAGFQQIVSVRSSCQRSKWLAAREWTCQYRHVEPLTNLLEDVPIYVGPLAYLLVDAPMYIGPLAYLLMDVPIYVGPLGNLLVRSTRNSWRQCTRVVLIVHSGCSNSALGLF